MAPGKISLFIFNLVVVHLLATHLAVKYDVLLSSCYNPPKSP